MLKNPIGWCITTAFVTITTVAWAAHSIPDDQLEAKKIYYGDASSFETPGEVDMDTVIKATPEWEEIEKKDIEKGTGKYWILLSQATDRAMEAVTEFAGETDYDLFAAAGYLGNLDPPIPADDVTESVVEKVEDE